MFHHLFERVNRFYERIFAGYGRFLAKYYILTIVCAFFLNLFLSAGMLRFNMIKDSDTLFMPVDSQARIDERNVKQLYNSSAMMTSDFFIHQLLDLGTWAEVNFQTCKPGENILHVDYLSEIKRLNEHLLDKAKVVVNLTANSSGDYEDLGHVKQRVIDFEEVCARRNQRCLIDGVDLLTPAFYDKWLRDAMARKQRFYDEQSFFDKSASAIAAEFRFYIKFENLKPSITDLTYNLGKDFRVNAVNESDNEREAGYARLLKLRYNLKSYFENADESVKLWELELLKELKRLAATSNSDGCIEFDGKRLFRISYATSQSLDLEMAENIALDTNLISGTFVLIMLFACLIMVVDSNCITSPGFLLPMMGITSAMFGMTSAFGFMSLIGYEGCSLIFVIPFLVIGIGIDDMFIIYATYLSCYRHKLCDDLANSSSRAAANKTAAKSSTGDDDEQEDKGKMAAVKKCAHTSCDPNEPNDSDTQIISELMSKALAKSGVSITITSLTDFVAFLVGLTTNFRSVQIFCVYAGVAIAFCYLYQITFFCGFLCLHIKRILNKRNAYLFCFKQSTFSKINLCNTFVCCTDLPALETSSEKIHQQQEELVELNRQKTTARQTGEQNDDDEIAVERNKPSGKYRFRTRHVYSRLQKTFKSFFHFLLCTKRGKVLGACLYLVYISLSIWSASQIREGINISDLVADNSYFSKYMRDNTELTDLNPIVMLVVYEPINYDSVHVRMKLKNLVADAFKIDGIKNGFSINWLNSFDNQKIRYKRDVTNLIGKLKDFPPFLNDLIIRRCELIGSGNKTRRENCQNLKVNPADDEDLDVDEENPTVVTTTTRRQNSEPKYEYEITSSRFYVQYSRVEFSSSDAKPMRLLRKLCSESGLPIMPYSITFKYYEQFEQTLPNVLQAFIIAIEAMYLISLMFIPDLVTVICIVTSMGSILVGLVGCMHMWSLTLSSVTMIELIMSVGFCVDFSAHICHAFIAKSGRGDRSRRAYKACMNVGMPIFNSALSTVIGLTLLAFCKSYIFISFFKTMTILMVLGVLNSLLFLPLLLSLIGPHWPRHSVNPPRPPPNNTNNDNNQVVDLNPV